MSSIYTRGIRYRGRERGILTCYPDTALATAKELMEAKGIKQLPVVKRGKEKKRRIVAILHYNSLISCLRLLMILKFWCSINKLSFTCTLIGIYWIYALKWLSLPEIPGWFILRKENVTNKKIFQSFWVLRGHDLIKQSLFLEINGLSIWIFLVRSIFVYVQRVRQSKGNSIS